MEKKRIDIREMLNNTYDKEGVMDLIYQMLYNMDIRLFGWEFLEDRENSTFNLELESGRACQDYTICLSDRRDDSAWESWNVRKREATKRTGTGAFEFSLSDKAWYRFFVRHDTLYLRKMSSFLSESYKEAPELPDIKLFLDLS